MILLDTSAILAHALQEPGSEAVGSILGRGEAWVAAPTWLEVRMQLARRENSEEVFQLYRSTVAGTVAITAEIADAAFRIRQATPKRLPTVDSLIAGAALVRGYTLLHRDAHFARIPQEVLSHESLPPKA